MNALKKISSLTLAGLLVIGGMELGENLGIPGVSGAVSKAEARVGRPLTPVSYAGVARRTTRRVVVRRTAVYVSTLPAGCVYGPYHGAHYYHCGSIYYEKSGTVYVKVVFE
jgi:hypothetical protein